MAHSKGVGNADLSVDKAVACGRSIRDPLVVFDIPAFDINPVFARLGALVP